MLSHNHLCDTFGLGGRFAVSISVLLPILSRNGVHKQGNIFSKITASCCRKFFAWYHAKSSLSRQATDHQFNTFFTSHCTSKHSASSVCSKVTFPVFSKLNVFLQLKWWRTFLFLCEKGECQWKSVVFS